MPPQPDIYAFDCEWAPDIEAGRRILHLPREMSGREVLQAMWKDGGATEEDPEPFLKTIRCRVVSIVSVVRSHGADGRPVLRLARLPENPDDPAQDEAYILRRFLVDGIGRHSPVLVGYNSRASDIHILAQRAFVKGLSVPRFAEKAEAKPWNSPDCDLMDLLGGRGRGLSASLNEIAELSGIPGKIGTTGDDVAGLFYGRDGEPPDYRRIVDYNTFDAITTYLVWLRMRFFRGAIGAAEYAAEKALARDFTMREAAAQGGAYLEKFLARWRELDPALFGSGQEQSLTCRE